MFFVSRELEDDIERVRSFYIKRVEETQRKADCQIRALKRGSALDTEAVIGDEKPPLLSVPDNNSNQVNTRDNVNDINDNDHSNDDRSNNNKDKNNNKNNIDDNNNNVNDINNNQNIENEKSNDNNINYNINQDKKGTILNNLIGISEIQNLKNQYDVKLLTLQLELNSTNERLRTLSMSPTALQAPPPPFIHDVRTAEIELLKLQYQKESENQKQIDREKWQKHVEERYERDRKDEKEKREYHDQKDDLRRRLKEEELKVEKLSSMTISLQNQLDGPKTPQMAQFMVIYLHR